MRLWSLHPKYLDVIGLIAVWREGLLAKKVIHGMTTGYKNHPQLMRFQTHVNPYFAINCFLYIIYLESIKRGYNFNFKKIDVVSKKNIFKIIHVTDGQILYEKNHLSKKLLKRNAFIKNQELNKHKTPDVNPIFFFIKGDIATWEKIKK